MFSWVGPVSVPDLQVERQGGGGMRYGQYPLQQHENEEESKLKNE